MSVQQDIQRMNEFFNLYGTGKAWDEIGAEFSSFYDKEVVYDIGADSSLGYDQLVAFGKQAFDGKASFKLDKIEAREEGIYSSGWMNFPGVGEGKYVQSVSKFKDGKFVYIKNVDSASDEALQKVAEQNVL